MNKNKTRKTKHLLVKIALLIAAIGSGGFAISDDSEGDAIWKSRCVTCHGPVGEGAFGPDLRDFTDEQLIEMLTDYKAGKKRGEYSAIMNGEAYNLTDEQIRNVSRTIYSM